MSHRHDTAEMLRAPEPAAPTVDDAFFHQLAGLALESVPRARPSRSPRAKVAAAAAGVALLTTGVAVAVDQLAQPDDRAPVGADDAADHVGRVPRHEPHGMPAHAAARGCITSPPTGRFFPGP